LILPLTSRVVEGVLVAIQTFHANIAPPAGQPVPPYPAEKLPFVPIVPPFAQILAPL
jgi:hypothetical protein